MKGAAFLRIQALLLTALACAPAGGELTFRNPVWNSAWPDPTVFPGSSPRALFLQRLYWDDDGWPYFETGHPLLEDRTPQL